MQNVSGATGAFVGGVNNNIVTTDPGLLPLAFYGGDFETHAAEADSPAIDAGLNPNNETRDGRGASFYVRSFGSGPDIGAFERQTRGYFVDVDTDVNAGVLDPGELSLREALREANANPGRDAITFDESITQISQSASAGGQWMISDALTLTGTGADRLDISGSFVSRVFNIDDGDGANEIDVSISDVTIKFGSVSGGANGGGILSRENVTLTRVEVDDNRVFGTGSVGGGIHIFGNGSLTMIDSAVTRNSSDGTSGGINIASTGGATITGSTISGNRTEGNAGGIGVFVGNVTIRNSTIANNRADDRNMGGGVGGGLYVIIPPTQGSVTLKSSLFAGNVIGFFSTGTRDDIRNLAGLDTAASRNNLVETTGVSAGGLTNGVNSNLVGAAAMLLPLNDYGGPVRTHGIVEGSPAIDAGSGGGATDIRGGVFQRSVGAGPDIGALEFQVFNFTVDNAGDVSDGDLSAGQVTLREALEIVGPNPGAETIRFSEALAGQTILLTGTQLDVGPETTIEGRGADRLTIDAQGLSRVLFASSFGFDTDLGDTVIRGLSITGGRVENSDGGGIRSEADGLLLDGVHVFGNRLVDDGASFDDGGAGLHSTGARTVIRDSTFSDNEGDGYGGAAFIGGDSLEVTNSTFSNNRTDTEGGAFYLGRTFNSASIRNSTFFRNQADADNDGGELGGAIYSALGATDALTLVSVLFASDTAAGVPNTLQFNDPTFVNFADSTNNLFSNAGSSATLVSGTNGNLISVNPQVGPLADNGGATPTHRPLPGSPAINNGANPDALSADQRGLARVADGAPDIGAFEYRRPIIGDFDLVSNLPAGEPAGTFKPLRGVLLRTEVSPEDGDVDRVEFYVDFNGSGTLEANELIGSDSTPNANGEYAFTFFPADSFPRGVPLSFETVVVDTAEAEIASAQGRLTLLVGRPEIESADISRSAFTQGDGAITLVADLDETKSREGEALFYHDADGDGMRDTSRDRLLGDAGPGDDFRYTLTPEQTAARNIGENTFFIVATDLRGNDAEPVTTTASVEYSLRAGDDNVVRGVADNADNHRLVTVNEAGDVLVFEQEGWNAVNLSNALYAPRAIGDALTWVDPKDNAVYAAYPSSEGLILLSRAGDGSWSFRNLNTELGLGSSEVVDQITQFDSAEATGRVVVIAGKPADGNVLVFRQTGGVNANGFQYTLIDLSDEAARGGFTLPRFTELISYRPAWDAWHLAGLDENGEIVSIWQPPGSTSWRFDNLSTITGAQPLAGGLSVILTSWNGITLTGLDANGSVISTWWVPQFGGDWRRSDLTEAFDGPQLSNAALTSFYTSWNAQNYAGVNEQGEIVVYWWVPQFGGQWRISTLTEAADDSTRITSALNAHASSASTLNVFGAAADGSVVRASWQPGDGQWGLENLTEVADRV